MFLLKKHQLCGGLWAVVGTAHAACAGALPQRRARASAEFGLHPDSAVVHWAVIEQLQLLDSAVVHWAVIEQLQLLVVLAQPPCCAAAVEVIALDSSSAIFG